MQMIKLKSKTGKEVLVAENDTETLEMLKKRGCVPWTEPKAPATPPKEEKK